MILLISPYPRVTECAKALQLGTGEQVTVAESLHRATALLRSEAYSLVVMDQHLIEAEPDQADTTMQHLGSAIPLQINFAISGTERVSREVRAALQRRNREKANAHRAAACLLRTELSGTVTALLLECELALKTAGLPTKTAERLRAAHDLVHKLRAHIENNATPG